jgi:hypothetical protein|uniref:Uncharacterized protein n=1 Tax=Oryza nivara TaxID=4536 RepID=A0A0E0GLH2_ORYNI
MDGTGRFTPTPRIEASLVLGGAATTVLHQASMESAVAAIPCTATGNGKKTDAREAWGRRRRRRNRTGGV